MHDKDIYLMYTHMGSDMEIHYGGNHRLFNLLPCTALPVCLLLSGRLLPGIVAGPPKEYPVSRAGHASGRYIEVQVRAAEWVTPINK